MLSLRMILKRVNNEYIAKLTPDEVNELYGALKFRVNYLNQLISEIPSERSALDAIKEVKRTTHLRDEFFEGIHYRDLKQVS